MMSSSRIEELAHEVVGYLRRENAVRINKDEVGNYLTVQEICDAIGIFVGDWTKVKANMLKRGMHICYVPGRGHYLGEKGEEVTNFVYKYKIARGWVKHMRIYKAVIESSSPEAREWIERRFKDFTLEPEEEMPYAERPA